MVIAKGAPAGQLAQQQQARVIDAPAGEHDDPGPHEEPGAVVTPHLDALDGLVGVVGDEVGDARVEEEGHVVRADQFVVAAVEGPGRVLEHRRLDLGGG